MQAADPCVECGGTELKLLDGYYYCVECNTQNTNARETVLEEKALGDGTFAIGTRRKIVKIHEIKIQSKLVLLITLGTLSTFVELPNSSLYLFFASV